MRCSAVRAQPLPPLLPPRPSAPADTPQPRAVPAPEPSAHNWEGGRRLGTVVRPGFHATRTRRSPQLSTTTRNPILTSLRCGHARPRLPINATWVIGRHAAVHEHPTHPIDTGTQLTCRSTPHKNNPRALSQSPASAGSSTPAGGSHSLCGRRRHAAARVARMLQTSCWPAYEPLCRRLAPRVDGHVSPRVARRSSCGRLHPCVSAGQHPRRLPTAGWGPAQAQRHACIGQRRRSHRAHDPEAEVRLPAGSPPC
jgi:hypothetical protein